MSEWKAKRFWTEAGVVETDNGFRVTLDGRSIKTPAKTDLIVPTRPLASAIAEEWDQQEDVVNPLTMPFTRSANAAIDKVAVQQQEVVDMLAAYGDADLLCYRADGPTDLQVRQADQWDPYLNWAADALGARLSPVQGVMHAAQNPDALQALKQQTQALTTFELTAFHDLVSLSGSLILGFAAARAWRPVDDIWRASRLDELWQEENWGPDDEATAQAETKKVAFFHAIAFYNAAQSG